MTRLPPLRSLKKARNKGVGLTEKADHVIGSRKSKESEKSLKVKIKSTYNGEPSAKCEALKNAGCSESSGNQRVTRSGAENSQGVKISN